MTTPFLKRGIWRSQWSTLPAGTAAAPALTFTGDTDTGLFSPAADTLAVSTGGSERLRITSAGNVGIGASSPLHPLDVNGSARASAFVVGSDSHLLYSANATEFAIRIGASGPYYAIGTTGFDNLRINNASGGDILLSTAGTERLRVANTGNVGIGVTPSAWTSYKAIQVGSIGSLSSVTGATIVGNNWFYDGASKYITTATATMYEQGVGTHTWFTAASGTAGTAITFTTAMVLDASGNLGVGAASFGTSAAKVLAIANGTEPSTGPADTVQFYSVDRSAGNTIPAIYCEGSGVTNAAITDVTVTNKIAIKVNGTVYYLLATTSAS